MIHKSDSHKSIIRNKMKKLKSSLTKEDIKKYSDKVYHHLMEHISFEQYDEVYLYVSFNQEVDTNPILDYLLQHRIKVAVPKIVDRQMEFYYINHKNQLEVGFYGILEPTTDKVAHGDNILMFMPGLAFDLSGNRIGYGAGYYDTYLQTHQDKRMHKIALAYDFQILDKLESSEYDVKIDGLITPTKQLLHLDKN